MNKKNIVWLASYPKSGNTWFRAFLTAMHSENQEVDINNLWISLNFASRSIFEKATSLNSYELGIKTIDNLKPEVFRQVSIESEERIYVKIHEHFHLTPENKPIIPLDKTLSVLYFIRNPLDVLVSFAYHSNYEIQKMADLMCEDYFLGGSQRNRSIPSMLHENLSNWSTHVKSWVDNGHLDVEVVRYEDMIANPINTFSRVLKFLKVDYTKLQLDKAIEASSFKNLQMQERNGNFNEKNPNSKSFFRRGLIGDWQNHLKNEKIEKFIDFHRELMTRFEYLV